MANEIENNNRLVPSASTQTLIQDLRQIVEQARRHAYAAVNQAMVGAYCYLTFPEIFATSCRISSEKFSTPWRILTWSHYKRLLQVPSEAARNWYLREASEQMWSYATLNRNISTQYYERLLMSQQKEPVVTEMKALTKDFDKDKLEFIKNPMVAEFLGMTPTKAFVENELERAILDNL